MELFVKQAYAPLSLTMAQFNYHDFQASSFLPKTISNFKPNETLPKYKPITKRSSISQTIKNASYERLKHQRNIIANEIRREKRTKSLMMKRNLFINRNIKNQIIKNEFEQEELTSINSILLSPPYSFSSNLNDEIQLGYLQEAKNCTLLHQLVVHTKKYPNLNDYIFHFSPDEINTPNSRGVTPLMVEIYSYYDDNHFAKSSFQTIQLLLKYGADPNLKNEKGYNSLYFATFYSTLEVMKLLLQNSVNINSPDNNGITPLTKAILEGHLEKTRLLLESGASVNFKDEDGYTTLHHVVKKGKFEKVYACIELLLTFGQDKSLNIIDVNGCPSSKTTPLHLAIRYFKSNSSSKDLVLLLLKHGANIHARNPLGETPIHKACQLSKEGSIEAVQILLDNGASINDIDEKGWSCFMFAACYCLKHKTKEVSLDIMKLLIQKGVNINHRNNNGEDVLDLIENDTVCHYSHLYKDAIEFIKEQKLPIFVEETYTNLPSQNVRYWIKYNFKYMEKLKKSPFEERKDNHEAILKDVKENTMTLFIKYCLTPINH
jgi:ankyrin repeat protein